MRLIENQRHLFEISDDVHYLNCAYMSPLLNSAVQAGHAAVSARARPWGGTPADFFSLSSTARDLSKRGDSLRIAPHLYNNEADMLALIHELENILNKH